ncbi:HK97-gp10 family putative phage morphogenesis protein [Prosthecomicrobium hirschii]|uniref:HK97-gp10 family putative phage morphogenesis protein n=1 Tax=Prosthecodimorpha hirschii TaxID=665126 RepID=UPI002220B68C|nr:HK97-gp10 family putative phage morphogenesis protein [Prosthecomicrobium hirschii]MCW1844126.1 HK97 gp10 family phage protein [Prosthecomicrobium hirschii]
MHHGSEALMAKATVTGDKELLNNLNAMARAFTGGVMDSVCKQAMAPLEAETKARARALRQPGPAPRGGHLDQGVAVAKQSVGGKRRVFWVGFKGRARKIAHLVEFGTKPHWQPKWRGGWMHPGARAKPFMRSAFEAKKREVLDVFAKLCGQVIAGSFKPVGRRK